MDNQTRAIKLAGRPQCCLRVSVRLNSVVLHLVVVVGVVVGVVVLVIVGVGVES